VFLEANDAAILRRFSETRRPHPLGTVGAVADGISHERLLLQPLRHLATHVVDTSRLTVHELRKVIIKSVGGTGRAAPLLVNITSFGFRRGTPAEADLVFDVRFLPNPHFVTALRKWSGRNARVSRYVLRTPAAAKFLTLTNAVAAFSDSAVHRRGQDVSDDRASAVPAADTAPWRSRKPSDGSSDRCAASRSRSCTGTWGTYETEVEESQKSGERSGAHAVRLRSAWSSSRTGSWRPSC
jgi:hypothetical protein